MAEDRSIDIIDYFIIVAKWKKFLLVLFFSVLVLSYISIYLFVDEEFESAALIIPTESEQAGGFSAMLKNFSGLPLGLGGINNKSSTDIYNTIIYSRTNLENLIKKFNLMDAYDIDNEEDMLKVLRGKITTKENDENAFEIYVRAFSPQESADMNNFIIQQLNNTIIDLNVKKSKDNRIFIEQRYGDINQKLERAEDSLKLFQEKSGVFLAEEQTKVSIETYAKLEAELAAKEVELSIFEKLYGQESPLYTSAQVSVNENRKKIQNIKSGNLDNNLLLSVKDIPSKAMDYLRYYREVEILNKMLEFIVPLYEQAKFEEQKQIPVLQVIDYAIAPQHRVYPHRIITSLIIAISIFLMGIFVLIFKESFLKNKNPKFIRLRKHLSLKDSTRD